MSDQDGTGSVDDAQAADSTGTPAPVADGGAQDGTDDATLSSLSPEDARKLRSENRSMRQRLKDAEQKLSDLETKDLTEKQRVERDLAAARAELEQADARARNAEVKLAAAKLGVRADAVDLVVSAIDWASVDDPSDSKQVERAIRDLVKDRPYLSARPEGLDGGKGRGTGQGENDMTSLIRRAAGRS
jgi:hypothetical protein